MNTPALLIILDGWGIADKGPGNALSLVDLPTIKRFERDHLHTVLAAAGEKVGLPKGHQGSSEMGHLMIGAGRQVVFPQSQIKAALDKGLVAKNAAYNEVMQYCHDQDKTLHLIGLLSDRGIHAYAELAYQLLALAKQKDVSKVMIHIIADGRDTLPTELPKFVKDLQAEIKKQDLGTIATIVGRYFAMDRDQRWDRVEKAYRLYTQNDGAKESTIDDFLSKYYKADNQELPATDEFIRPTVFAESEPMEKGDGVIFWNFRVDRAVELAQAFTEKSFEHFKRTFPELHFVATTAYYDEIKVPVAFGQERIEEPLGEVLSKAKLKQLRLAETEKWAYVTKVFDGYQEVDYPLETKKLISSDKVATYDLKPKMQADQIAKTIVEALQSKKYDVIIANFANADMVGHTANLEATKVAVQAVDEALALIDTELEKQHGFMCITADHGNCEEMLTADGGKNGSHTDNQVPFYLVNYQPALMKRLGTAKLQTGTLSNVAPTFLDLLGIVIPSTMINSLVL